jgi:hypothetical protein
MLNVFHNNNELENYFAIKALVWGNVPVKTLMLNITARMNIHIQHRGCLQAGIISRKSHNLLIFK